MQLLLIDLLINLITCLTLSSLILMFQETLLLHWSKCLHQKHMRNHINLQFKEKNTHHYIEVIHTRLNQKFQEILILKVTHMFHLFTHHKLVMCYQSKHTLHMYHNMLLHSDTNLFSLLIKAFIFHKRLLNMRKYLFISTNQNHKNKLLKLMKQN